MRTSVQSRLKFKLTSVIIFLEHKSPLYKNIVLKKQMTARETGSIRTFNQMSINNWWWISLDWGDIKN
jgi:hypothetical protein